jgi:hypothetical protein
MKALHDFFIYISPLSSIIPVIGLRGITGERLFYEAE